MSSEQKTQGGGVGLAKGTKVGKYEVVERLGIGGQAVVYKGHDPLLDRFVALKQVSSHLAADEKFLERFRREAQILAKLGGEQESIVTIHELIEDERGLFIVMEYLSGHSLETVLADTGGPSEPKAVLQIIWRLAAALNAVHNAGIIHRDLKPSNIIVGDGLRAKITDFGVAASITGQTSMVLGTTKYMAPELFEGAHVDGRADMYSLGFIAYELLAGRPKFDEIFADIVRDKHSEALRWMKWHGNLSVRAPGLEEVNPSVPHALSGIIAKMMAKDVEERYRGMEELGRAIKTSFSPRAKAARRARRGGAAPALRPVAAGALTAEDSGAPLVTPDEGDELEVAAGAAATAPLPASGLGRKVLLFFVVPLVLLLILGGAAAGVIRIIQQRRLRRQEAELANRTYSTAVTTLKEALKTYERAKFDSAAKGFIDVRTRFGHTLHAVKASVLLPLCQAYLSMADGDWEAAKLKQNDTARQIKLVQGKYSSLATWAREARDYERNFDSYYTATRSFREAITRARDEFGTGRYGEARLIIRRDLRDVSLTTGQEELVDKFLREVDLKEFREQLAAQVQKADDLAGEGKFREAEEAYQQAQALLRTERASVLPADEGKTQGRTIAAKLKSLTENRAVQLAMAEVAKARASGDKSALVDKLRNLDRLQPSDPIKEEIRTLQAEIHLAVGRDLVAAGKTDQARQAFAKSIEYKDTKDARDEIARLEQADQRASLVSAGDAQFANANWGEALAKYQEAAKLQMDDDLARKINECRFRIGLGQADALRRDRNYDEATKAYMALANIKPAARPLIDARLAAMEADRKYEKFLADGDAALKRAQWPKAREFYIQAQKVRSTAEVQGKITETRYQENKARGQEALEQRDYNGALGYFQLAKRFKDTQEIRGLIAKAEKGLKDAG